MAYTRQASITITITTIALPITINLLINSTAIAFTASALDAVSIIFSIPTIQ